LGGGKSLTKGPGMRQLCENLERANFNLSDADAVEVFARQGDWHTVDYFPLVRSLEVWEIDEVHLSALRRNLPGAQVRQVNSIEYASAIENQASFDFIVIDNPQSVFGISGEYCEHFDLIDTVPGMLRSDGVVVFNVNIEPFNYDEHPKWRERRDAFYDSGSTNKLSLSELEVFYTKRFEATGKSVVDSFWVKRTDYLYYMAFRLITVNEEAFVISTAS